MKLSKLSDVKRCIFEFAYSRAGYKDQLEHKLIGAISHFYQVEFAKANGKKKWTEHWLSEHERLLKEFGAILRHTVKGCRNRRKAAEEVLQIIVDGDSNHRRAAINTVCGDFGQKLRKPLPKDALGRFCKLVKREIDRNLRPDGTID